LYRGFLAFASFSAKIFEKSQTISFSPCLSMN